MSVSTRAALPEKMRLGWVGLALILLIIGIAGFVCYGTVPWQMPNPVPIIIFVKGLVPLFLLLVLALLIHHNSRQIWKALQKDQIALEQLPDLASDIIEDIYNSRQKAINKEIRSSDNEAAQDREHRISEILGSPDERLVSHAVDYVKLHYVAGETLSSESLLETLKESALDRVEPLQKKHEYALAIGFAGTVLGLIVQGYFAQSYAAVGILSNAFLAGFMIATTATFIGIVVAVYARALRSRLLQSMDDLCFDTQRHLCSVVFPVLSQKDRGATDVLQVIKRLIENFSLSVDSMASKLKGSIDQGAESAIKRLDAYSNTELFNNLRTKVVEPIGHHVGQVATSISASAQVIQSTSSILARKMDEMRIMLESTKGASDEVTNKVIDAVAEIQALTRDIESIRSKFKDVAGLLDQASGNVAVSIEEARAMEAEWRSHLTSETEGMRMLVAELSSASDTLRQALNGMTQAISVYASSRRMPLMGREDL